MIDVAVPLHPGIITFLPAQDLHNRFDNLPMILIIVLLYKILHHGLKLYGPCYLLVALHAQQDV